jgi:hypothetical protein
MPAFLRGIERRALQLAQSQCGDPVLAQAALSATLREFAESAGSRPLAFWPADFWRLLLAQPELALRSPTQGPLAALSAGPRAVLLLRLIAGLDIAHVAQILGVQENVSKLALERALAQAQAGGVSQTQLLEWRRVLSERSGAAAMSSDRVAAPAWVRSSSPSAADPPTALFSLRSLAWAVLGLLMLALAASFVWSPSPRPAQITAASPRIEASTSPYQDAVLVTHPDYAQLVAPADHALAQELPLLSWLAAGAPVEQTQTISALQEIPGPESAQADTEAPP